MPGLETKSSRQELPFQQRFADLLASTVEFYPVDAPPTVWRHVMGDPSDWPFPDFRPAPIDLEFIQGSASTSIKTLLPGSYWIHPTPISRRDVANGYHLQGQSIGPHIYVDEYVPEFNPTPAEADLAHAIAVHEASHQVDDTLNQVLYKKIKARKNRDSKGILLDSHLKRLKSLEELGSWELTIEALLKSQQNGVFLFTGGAAALQQTIIDALSTRQWLLAFEVK